VVSLLARPGVVGHFSPPHCFNTTTNPSISTLPSPIRPLHVIAFLHCRFNDGTPMPGCPIDVADALRDAPQPFNSRDQNERGALTIVDGTLYVPFGGHFGDCGDYHRWVVGAFLTGATRRRSWPSG
jgi:hypothetical protein